MPYTSPSPYETGTVTLEAGNVSVIGNLTGWFVNGVNGGMFCRDGMAVPIRSVEDDTHLTLAYGWPGANAAGVSYVISRETALAADALFANNTFVKVLRDLAISSVHPDGSGTLAERNALSPVPAVGYIWLRIEVGQPLELYKKEISGWSGPYGLTGPQGAPGVGSGGFGLPLGGILGQVLRKIDANDGNSEWASIASILGYVPVRQGTGVGQNTNEVAIGGSATGPKITVNSVDEGRIWTDIRAGAVVNDNTNILRLPNGIMLLRGYNWVSTDSNGLVTISYPVAFDVPPTSIVMTSHEVNGPILWSLNERWINVNSFSAVASKNGPRYALQECGMFWQAIGRWKA